MENEMLIPWHLGIGTFTALCRSRRPPAQSSLFVRLGFFLFGGMICHLQPAGSPWLAKCTCEGGLVEIISIGIFLCSDHHRLSGGAPRRGLQPPRHQDHGTLRITLTLIIINATATWLILAMPEFPPGIAALASTAFSQPDHGHAPRHDCHRAEPSRPTNNPPANMSLSLVF